MYDEPGSRRHLPKRVPVRLYISCSPNSAKGVIRGTFSRVPIMGLMKGNTRSLD